MYSRSIPDGVHLLMESGLAGLAPPKKLRMIGVKGLDHRIDSIAEAWMLGQWAMTSFYREIYCVDLQELYSGSDVLGSLLLDSDMPNTLAQTIGGAFFCLQITCTFN